MIEGLQKSQQLGLLDLIRQTSPTDPHLDRKIHELKGQDRLILDLSELEGLVTILQEVAFIGNEEEA